MTPKRVQELMRGAFDAGVKQGEDVATAYEWGGFPKQKDDAAFKDYLDEIGWDEIVETEVDIEVERILSLSDGEIDAELRAEGLDPATVATEMRATIERAFEEAAARKAERK